MLELVDITKSFHEGQPNAYTALKDVSLTLERGKVIALHGPSGSGKTTLLTLIGCLACSDCRIFTPASMHPPWAPRSAPAVCCSPRCWCPRA